MPLSSTSTLAQVQAAYDDNATFEEDGSVAKAKAFVTACRILLRRIPANVSHASGASSQGVQHDMEQIRQELERARRWILNHDIAAAAGARAEHLSFEEFR